MPETDLIERLEAGIPYLSRMATEDSQEYRDFLAMGDNIVVNEGGFWMGLHTMREAATALSEKDKRIAELEASDKDWGRLHQKVIMERAAAIQRAEAAEAQLATALADKAKMEAANGWEVSYTVRHTDGEFCASSTSLADAQHYALIYGHDGPVEILEVRTRTLPTKPEGGEDEA